MPIKEIPVVHLVLIPEKETQILERLHQKKLSKNYQRVYLVKKIEIVFRWVILLGIKEKRIVFQKKQNIKYHHLLKVENYHQKQNINVGYLL